MIIAAGVAVIVGVIVGVGVAVCSGTQEVRRRARREIHKSRVRIAFHSRVSPRVLSSNGYELRSPAHFAGSSPANLLLQ